jgi:autotransporter-associated beta strand protein
MKTQKHPLLKAPIWFAVIAVFSIFSVQPAFAGTRTWNGGAAPDGNWTNPGNWNGVAPTTNDLLVFSGATQTATTNNFATGMPFNNVGFASGASSFTVGGNAFTLSEPTDAGSGQIVNGSIVNLSANSETIRAPIGVAAGNHTISSSVGTLNLNGAITRSNGAVVTMLGHINVTGGLATNGSANGILGGWAIFNNNWATLDANSNVVAYTAYTDVAGGGTIPDNAAANVRIPVNGAAINITAPTTHINSLLFGSTTASAATQVLNVGAGNKLVLGQDGGIFNNTGVAGGGTSRQLTIGANVAQGGTLTAGDGTNAATIRLGSAPLPSASTVIAINSVITDNGTAPVTMVVASAYVSFNGGGNTATTNTYTGGTYILQGRVSQPGLGTFGTGPVYIFPGGQANMGCQVPNDFYIEGSGTVENQGMGALRLYSASLATGFTGNLPGTIHLMGPANICADNIAVAAQLIGISGKITGPGSLGIGSPTATTRSGVINIGSTNGASAIRNDYAGDTIINGINGGTISSTLRICDPADNNIMPHGSTGSFAGGRTGNLILNGTLSTRQAIFDLNGSTQTINGISSTATSPLNNIVTDNLGGGGLIIGDSDATSTFGGIIQNSVVLTKIGTGTITLSGPNTYTGDTIVKAGRLITTTASTGSGNFSVSNNAALGVTVASAGGTLPINNLTLASGSSLQLNAGTFGPGTAIANVTGALNITGTVDISLSGIGLTAGGPFPILTYNAGTRTGGGSFHLVTSPRIVANLTDDGVGTVSVTIVSADTAIKWMGLGSNNWDINNVANTIWQTVPSGNPASYIESGSGNDSVIFNDTATGNTTVNLTTALTPQTVAVTNTTKSYTFTGTGKITGATGLVKDGTNTLTIANSGANDFSGNITLTAGTLVISNDWNLANPITGSGALVKNGPGTLTLSGDNSAFSGPVTITGGTLSVQNSASLVAVSAITITNGGSLDIGNNNVSVGGVPITVSGSGAGGNGAIVNSSGYGGGTVATSFQNLTMAADTTVGGPGRLDFADGTLSTGGQARKLTKVSTSTLRMANLTLDNALGDIEIQAGTLSLQGAMSSFGNPANSFIVAGSATLQFNSLGIEIDKRLVIQDNGVVNNNGGLNTYDGPVTLQGNGIFNIAGSGMTFTNVISGTGSLSKVTGNAAMTLMASNTYTGDTTIGAGTLFLNEPASINASRSIAIGANATLDVNGRLDQSLTLLSGKTLSGNGTLNGSLLVTNGAVLSPGSGVGTFTVSGNVSLAGSTVIEINKPFTNDVLNCFNVLTYGGTLVISNIGTALAEGDVFPLFPNQNYAGAFSAIVPATPGNGLAWDTNSLSVDGTLKVVAGAFVNPTTNANITSVKLSGTNVLVHGTNNNVPNTSFHYVVLTSTNIALPLSNWTPVVTNPFNPDGTFDYTNAIVPGTVRQFIDVQAVP